MKSKIAITICLLAMTNVSTINASQTVSGQEFSGNFQQDTTFSNTVITLELQASKTLDVSNNEVDQLRYGQFKHHINNARAFRDANVARITQQQLSYAEDLLNLPKKHTSPGAL